MSIRLRLTIALLMAATVPLLIVGIWNLYTLKQTSQRAIELSEQALIQQGEKEIFQNADAVARQIELYLNTRHIDLTDIAQLESTTVLAEISVQPVGQTGYTAVFDAAGIVHFHANSSLIGVNMNTLADELPGFWAIYATALDGSPSDGYYDWQDADGQIRSKYMSIVPVRNTRLRVAATTYMDEFSHPIIETRSQLANMQTTARIQTLLAMVGVTLIAFGGALYLGRQYSRPIRQMADAVTRIADGEPGPIYLQERRDEIGALARAFNTMSNQLYDLISRLAERSKELSQRATELEESDHQSQRRATQLEASTQIARAVASVLDPGQLLQQVVHLISDHFGHYHTGVFLLDETGQWAVLQAANSKGGQRMLAQAHRLEVGRRGIVGQATQTGQPHVALDVGADAVYFDNPDLPETRSEIALPLIARGQTVGALDVQSKRENAFDQQDIAVLSALADQIAVALDNARLYEASQNALAQMQIIQRQYVREAWREHGAQREADFYEYRTGQPEQEMVVSAGDDGQAVAVEVPIKVRDQIIGTLGLEGQDHTWSDDEIALMETVADQVAQAMDAARLFNDTRRRAQREQLVAEIAGKIRSAPDIDGILRTAVQEIRSALGVSHGVIRLGTETHLRPPEVRDEG